MLHISQLKTDIPYTDTLEAQRQILAKVLIFALNHDRERTLDYIAALKDSLTYNTNQPE